MNLRIIRKTFTEKSTIGELHINGQFFCYTLEDKDRGLDDSMSLLTIKAKKIFGLTAIPYGSYKMIVNVSPKMGRLLPRFVNIKGFDGVLIHRGNTATDSLGCVIVGYKKGIDSVYESTKAEADLVSKIKNQTDITIDIVKD